MLLVFCIMAGIIVLWAALTVSAWLSLRWSQRPSPQRARLRLVMAVVPLLAGYFLFTYHLRFTMNGSTIGVSWIFLLPIVLGALATVVWMRSCGQSLPPDS